MKTIFLSIAVFFASALIFTACGAASPANQKPADAPKAAETKPADNAGSAKTAELSKPDAKTDTTAKTAGGGDKEACLKAHVDGKKLIPDQTFVFDFEPFRGTCFVTFANKDEMVDDKDVPRGSTFHIFRDGEFVYQFPDAFDDQPACWVEGVAFDDLNDDGKTDVIIAGQCLSAKNSYPSNAVYLNTGKDFKTDAEKNRQLDNFKKISEIKDYVKKNAGKFF